MSLKTKSFTLIELLVVIAIIMVLSTFVVINVMSSQKKARDDKRITSANVIGSALDQYAMANGRKYPNTLGGTVLETDKYYVVAASGLSAALGEYLSDSSIIEDTKIQYVFKGDLKRVAVVVGAPEVQNRSKCNIDESVIITPASLLKYPTIMQKYLANKDLGKSFDTPFIASGSVACYYISK